MKKPPACAGGFLPSPPRGISPVRVREREGNESYFFVERFVVRFVAAWTVATFCSTLS